MDTTKITVQATVDADVKTAWNAYTEPQHITQWNFASDDWCCPSASNDLRPGGKYTARMEAKDGSLGFDFEAVYDEVNEHRGFTYTIADGRKVTTTFEGKDGKTLVTTIFDPEQVNPIEMQQGGWQAILNNYARHAGSIGK